MHHCGPYRHLQCARLKKWSEEQVGGWEGEEEEKRGDAGISRLDVQYTFLTGMQNHPPPPLQPLSPSPLPRPLHVRQTPDPLFRMLRTSILQYYRPGNLHAFMLAWINATRFLRSLSRMARCRGVCAFVCVCFHGRLNWGVKWRFCCFSFFAFTICCLFLWCIYFLWIIDRKYFMIMYVALLIFSFFFIYAHMCCIYLVCHRIIACGQCIRARTARSIVW